MTQGKSQFLGPFLWYNFNINKFNEKMYGVLHKMKLNLWHHKNIN